MTYEENQSPISQGKGYEKTEVALTSVFHFLLLKVASAGGS